MKIGVKKYREAMRNKKYEGRSDTENIVWSPVSNSQFNLGNKTIKWGDVSFFTLHNPKLIFDFFKTNNLPTKIKNGYNYNF